MMVGLIVEEKSTEYHIIYMWNEEWLLGILIIKQLELWWWLMKLRIHTCIWYDMIWYDMIKRNWRLKSP